MLRHDQKLNLIKSHIIKLRDIYQNEQTVKNYARKLRDTTEQFLCHFYQTNGSRDSFIEEGAMKGLARQFQNGLRAEIKSQLDHHSCINDLISEAIEIEKFILDKTSQIICQFCNEIGHSALHCQFYNNPILPQNQTTCQLCYTIGHSAIDCTLSDDQQSESFADSTAYQVQKNSHSYFYSIVRENPAKRDLNTSLRKEDPNHHTDLNTTQSNFLSETPVKNDSTLEYPRENARRSPYLERVKNYYDSQAVTSATTQNTKQDFCNFLGSNSSNTITDHTSSDANNANTSISQPIDHDNSKTFSDSNTNECTVMHYFSNPTKSAHNKKNCMATPAIKTCANEPKDDHDFDHTILHYENLNIKNFNDIPNVMDLNKPDLPKFGHITKSPTSTQRHDTNSKINLQIPIVAITDNTITDDDSISIPTANISSNLQPYEESNKHIKINDDKLCDRTVQILPPNADVSHSIEPCTSLSNHTDNLLNESMVSRSTLSKSGTSQANIFEPFNNIQPSNSSLSPIQPTSTISTDSQPYDELNYDTLNHETDSALFDRDQSIKASEQQLKLSFSDSIRPSFKIGNTSIKDILKNLLKYSVNDELNPLLKVMS